MDDPRILRIITVGLVLAALAVGYFLLTGGFSVKSKKVQNQTNKVAVESPTPSAVAGIDYQPASTTSPAPQSAYDRIASRSQSSVQSLPNTGFPEGIAIVFSVGTLVAGWSLRKYPY